MRLSCLVVLLVATAAVAVTANDGAELVPAVIEDAPLPSTDSTALVQVDDQRRLDEKEQELYKELVPAGSQEDTDDNIECGEGLDELTDGETLRAVYLLASKVLIETKTTGEATKITENQKNTKAEWVMNKLPKTLIRLLYALAELLSSKRLNAEERRETEKLALENKLPTITKAEYDLTNKKTTAMVFGQTTEAIFRLYKREMDHGLSQERLAQLNQKKGPGQLAKEKEDAKLLKEWNKKHIAEQKEKNEYNNKKEAVTAAEKVLADADKATYPKKGFFGGDPKTKAKEKAQKDLDKAKKEWNEIKSHTPTPALEPFKPSETPKVFDTVKSNVELVAQKFDYLFAGVTKIPFELPSLEKEPSQPIFKSLTAFTPKAESKVAVNCKALEMVIDDASNRMDENDDKMNKFVEIAKTALKVTNFIVTTAVRAGASASPAGPAGGALAGAAAGAVMDVIENVGSKVLDQDASVRTLRRTVRRAMLATFKGYVRAHVAKHQKRVRKQLMTAALKEAVEKAEASASEEKKTVPEGGEKDKKKRSSRTSKSRINVAELRRSLLEQINDVDIDDPDCTSAMRHIVRDVLTMLHPGSDLKLVTLLEQCSAKSKEEAKEVLNPSTFSRLLPALQLISDKSGFDMSAVHAIEPINPNEIVNDFISNGAKEIVDSGLDYYKELLDDKEAEEDKEKQLDALNEINSSVKDLSQGAALGGGDTREGGEKGKYYW